MHACVFVYVCMGGSDMLNSPGSNRDSSKENRHRATSTENHSDEKETSERASDQSEDKQKQER